LIILDSGKRKRKFFFVFIFAFQFHFLFFQIRSIIFPSYAEPEN